MRSRMRILVIALGSIPDQSLLHDVTAGLDRGDEVTMVLPRLDQEDGIDARTSVLDLFAHTQYAGRPPTPRSIDCSIPHRNPARNRVVARRTLARRHKTPVVGLSTAAQEAAASDTAEEVTDDALARKRSRRIARRTMIRRGMRRIYRATRPVLLWRLARPHLRHDIDLRRFDVIIAADQISIPAVWNLRRDAPQAHLGLRLPTQAWKA
jgi:hypothetical protein